MKKNFLIMLSTLIILCGGIFGFAQEGESEREEKIDELITSLESRNWEGAVDSLVEIGEPAVASLIKALNRGSGWTAQRANYALARIGTNRAVEAIICALKNKTFNQQVRGYAALALGEISSKEVIDPLIEALRYDDHWYVRMFAAESLGKLGPEKAVEPLIEALNDDVVYVRRNVLVSLAKFKSVLAINPIIELFKDEDWSVRLKAPDILVEFGESAVESLVNALQSGHELVKVKAAYVLGKIKAEKGVTPLIKLIEDQNLMVRDEAAVALSRINSEKAIQPLLELLKNKNSHIREEVVWILGELRVKTVVEPLIQALSDTDMGWMAAVSLGKIGDESAVEPLITYINSDNIEARRSAAWALVRIRSEASVEPLVEALTDEDGEVRMLAALALEKIATPRALKALENHKK
jgi:HEAT repeat protein